MKNETARREIESLDYYFQNYTRDYSEKSHMAMMMAIKALEQEPKTGHWINTADPRYSDNIVCNLCGFDSMWEYDFCPKCGAKMEEQA